MNTLHLVSTTKIEFIELKSHTHNCESSSYHERNIGCSHLVLFRYNALLNIFEMMAVVN